MDINNVLKKFTCDDCNQVFSAYKQFFLHRKSHTSLFRSVITEEMLLDESCPLCLVKYYEKYKYECLEELLGSGRVLRGCKQAARVKQVKRCKYYPKCNAEFYVSSRFYKHAKEVHNDDKPFACQLCNYTAKRYRDLKVHLWNHVGYKMFKCELCPKAYTRNETLKQHILSTHKEITVRSHDCFYCGKQFYTAPELRRHLEARPPDCSYCDKEFCFSSELKRHLKIHHPTEGAETNCHLCSKTFSKRRSLTDHLKTHFKMFKCHRCTKEYARKDSLTQHLLSSHKEGNIKSHDCSHCGEKFIRPSVLEAHLGRYHPSSEASDKSYDCSECNKKYFWRNELRRHIIRQHPNVYEAGTECNICSKKFPNLKAHLQSHYKVFKCHRCTKEYRKKEGLTRHLLSMHNEVNTIA